MKMDQKGCLRFVTAERKYLCAIMRRRMIPLCGIYENNVKIIPSMLSQGKNSFWYCINLPSTVLFFQDAHMRKIGMACGTSACRHLLSKEDGG